MKNTISLCTTLAAAALTLAIPQVSFAEAPTIQTVGPVIHLAENLDEDAMLGWCIDTDGRGQSDQLHAHSCKPTGDDVLFSYVPDSGQIQSATYDGLCKAYNAPDSVETPFGLIACDATDEAQSFVYDDSPQVRGVRGSPRLVLVAAVFSVRSSVICSRLCA